MCVIPVFQHTCGCRKPFEDAIERCEKAEAENASLCEIKEEITDDPYPCPTCFDKQTDDDAMRVALAASATDYNKQADLESEAQLRAAMAASADDYARRAKKQEDDEFARAMEESMRGVSLEDRWEVDDRDMVELLKRSRNEFFREQEDELRRRGFMVGNKSLPRGEWTQRETIHDRPGPSGTQPRPGPSGTRAGPSGTRAGPSGTQPRPNAGNCPSPSGTQAGPSGSGSGPPKPFVPLPQEYGDSDDEFDEEPEPARPPPPADPRVQIRRLADYPPNMGPDGKQHPLILYQYMGCYHDIPVGIDYSREVGPNEPNAIRKPMPGKCPACDGKPPPWNIGKGKAADSCPAGPAYESKGKEKAVEKPADEVSGANNIVPLEPELSPQELRQKRLAMMLKNTSKAGPGP